MPIHTENAASIHHIPQVSLSHLLDNQPKVPLAPGRRYVPFRQHIVPRVEGEERNHIHDRCESHGKRPEE